MLGNKWQDLALEAAEAGIRLICTLPPHGHSFSVCDATFQQMMNANPLGFDAWP